MFIYSLDISQNNYQFTCIAVPKYQVVEIQTCCLFLKRTAFTPTLLAFSCENVSWAQTMCLERIHKLSCTLEFGNPEVVGFGNFDFDFPVQVVTTLSRSKLVFNKTCWCQIGSCWGVKTQCIYHRQVGCENQGGHFTNF